MASRVGKGRWALLAALVVSGTAAQDRLPLCAACHGADGNSEVAGTPSLAGQPKLFLETQLVLFREEVRVSPQMQPAVKGLSDREIVRLAAHYAVQPARPARREAGDPARVKQGIALARKLHCGSCHLPDFRGREQIPRLAGQREDYLTESMFAYRDNRRSGGDTIMAAALYGVSDADIRALAHYLSRLR
ncbi:MAG: c-type cytochrome [Burkholderiales bacterium]